jgi:putative transport protein
MIDTLTNLLSGNPIMLLFLVLGIGYVIGSIRFGSFQLGSVAGVLIGGLLLGHLGFESNAAIQSLGFVLFIFSVGYEAGPKFVQAMRKDGRRYLTIAVVVAVTGFGLAVGASRLLGFEPGVAAGVLAGALTSTPTLAAADAAVASSTYAPPDGLSLEDVRSNITTAYAITYIFGLVGLIFVIRLLPRALNIDLVAEAAALEREDAAAGPRRLFTPEDVVVHAVRIDNPDLTGKPLGELYRAAPIQFTVLKIRRRGELIEPTPETTLELGDSVSMAGVLTAEAIERLADVKVQPTVRDRELLDYRPASDQVCVTRKDAVGLTLGELEITQRHASFVSGVSRMGVDLEVAPATKLERGDVLHVTGPRAGLEALGARLGHFERDVEKTDLSTFAWAIVLGILVGTWAVKIAGVSIGLGSAGGLLVMGLAVGYARSLLPVFGRVPVSVRWMLTELGLLLFMAGVGLRGGADLVATLLSSGIALLLAGIIVTLVPLILAYAIGRRLLHMNPLMLLGAITGAMTSGGALSVINSQAKSTIAGIGYTGAYAFANVLLTVAGAVIVLL